MKLATVSLIETYSPGAAGEHLGDEERLAHEPLQAAGPADGRLVLLGQLVDAEDRDDVLEVAVALQDALRLLGDVVVLLADDERVEDARRRGQRIDRRVDARARRSQRSRRIVESRWANVVAGAGSV